MRTPAFLVLCVLLVASACGGGAAPLPTASVTVTPSSSSPPSPPSPSPPSPSSSPTARPPTGSPAPSRTAPPSAAAEVLWRGATTRKQVALTFDAGSDTGHAVEVLDVLRDRQVPAAFGLTGAWVRANPALARRVVSEGHLVVNHTDRHLSFTGRSTGTAPLTREQRREALDRAEAALQSASGKGFGSWFRPPYGDRDASVDRDVAEAGYRTELMWTVDTLGWKGVPPDTVVDRVLDAAGPGCIVLMHVGTASTDWQALAAVVDRLRALGYTLVRPDRFGAG